jgi:hypothetical protein
MVFYPSRNQEDVSRFEEEALVDKNEARNRKVCVEESKPIISDPPETCNPCAFPSGNGRTFAWISLWVYLAPRVGITRYGSSWTA